METKHLTKSLLFLTALALSACAETRFGEPVMRGPNGALPPLMTPVVSEKEAEALYESSTLHRELDGNAKIRTQWTQLRRKLADPTAKNAKKRQRIGRLLAIAKGDKTELRQVLVQLWAIRYGQNLEEGEASAAERVMTSFILPQADLGVFYYISALQFLIAPDRPLEDEDRLKIIELDHFFRTGEERHEPRPAPPISKEEAAADAERSYRNTELHPRIGADETVKTLWEEMQTNLLGSDVTRAEKRQRIGRLLTLAKADRADIRVPLVQLWAIRYGQALVGAEAAKAERILQASFLVTNLTDLLCFLSLKAAVAQKQPLTDEQREMLDRVDGYFLNEGPKSSPPPMERVEK